MDELHGVKFVTAAQAAELLGDDITIGTVHGWVAQRKVVPAGRMRGVNIYRWRDMVEVEQATRESGRGRPRGSSSLFLTETRCSDTMSETVPSDHAARKPGRRRAPAIPPLARPVVYYIRFGDRIKIGYSECVLNRLHDLPYDEVLALEPGGRDVERQRHEQFDAHRVRPRGEWFHVNSALLKHVKAVRAEHGSPADVVRKSPAMPPTHRPFRE